MAHPTLGNRPVPASPYPRESQSFASHANTRRVIRTTSARFSPSFLAPESFFSLSLSLSRPFLPPPRCLVREFSWLAELTAFGKIASSTHRSYQRGLLSLTRRYPPLLLRVRHLPRSFPFSPSLLRIACTTRTRIHTHTVAITTSWVRQCSFGERWRRGPTRATKSLPLLEPVSRDVVTHVVLLCPVSHVNLLLRPRAAEGRDEEVEEGRERERLT